MTSCSDPVSTQSGGAAGSGATSASARTSIAARSARVAVTARVFGGLASSVQVSPCASTGMMPAIISSVTRSPAFVERADDVRRAERRMTGEGHLEASA